MRARHWEEWFDGCHPRAISFVSEAYGSGIYAGMDELLRDQKHLVASGPS